MEKNVRQLRLEHDMTPFDIYDKGYADGKHEQIINQCNHDQAIKDAYEQGKRDMIDKIIQHIDACKKEAYENNQTLVGAVLTAIKCYVEQLKEQK